MFARAFSNRVIHVPQKDRPLYTALINTFCAILMGIAALQLAIKPEALMAPLAARGVTPDNWALDLKHPLILYDGKSLSDHTRLL